MEAVEGGGGMYAATRLWETEAMLEMKMSEEQYSAIELPERARKVIGMNLRNWMKMLEEDKEAKRIKAESKK